MFRNHSWILSSTNVRQTVSRKWATRGANIPSKEHNDTTWRKRVLFCGNYFENWNSALNGSQTFERKNRFTFADNVPYSWEWCNKCYVVAERSTHIWTRNTTATFDLKFSGWGQLCSKFPVTLTNTGEKALRFTRSVFCTQLRKKHETFPMKIGHKSLFFENASDFV